RPRATRNRCAAAWPTGTGSSAWRRSPRAATRSAPPCTPWCSRLRGPGPPVSSAPPPPWARRARPPRSPSARVARHLRAALPTIGERWRPQLGVKTGADEVFLVPEPGPGTRPALRGRDLAPFAATPRVHLLWTHAPDGRPLARLPPALARALGAHLERLRRRSDYRAGAPWQLFRTALAVTPYRVVWADVARRLAAAVPDPET